ncbi:GMC oxidoreductase [Franconibacter helveticus]|uniref:GMC oxidoreductase n=1 Tax=Franconibacter helveticus TaxID=357240 RepID=UPI00066D773C|nr:GMC oxidoreductase [Franconibacter helveticus]
MNDSIDVLIIGSGPVGAAFARHLADNGVTNILVVEAGSALTPETGLNIRNLTPEAREVAWRRAREFPLAAVPPSQNAKAPVARPGTHLLNAAGAGDDPHQGMPAAAMSSNLGGMGVHWTCACPRPGDSEKIAFLDAAELDAAFQTAESYLRVTAQGFPQTALSQQIITRLNQHFGAARPVARQAQPMPLACTPRDGDKPCWSGVDAVLGELAQADVRARRGVEIRTNTLCRRLLTHAERVTGAELYHLPDGEAYTVTAKVVIVAADALRTPQLLYASGIRPHALGRWLNDQPQVIALIEVDAPATATSPVQPMADGRDNVSGVTWLPFHEADFPFHGQLMQMDTSPIAMQQNGPASGKPVVGLGLFLAKALREEDRIVFEEETDALGMPRMRLEYQLTQEDHARLAQALKMVTQVGDALGGVAQGGEAMILPAGTSLHYQGTYRIGPVDDGTCVADTHSRVWGYDNLYVGGNGAIPGATACNPTLTSVALAVMAADAITARFFR